MAKRLQEIAAEDSDDESDSTGSAEVGKKRKRTKTQDVKPSHWEELISVATNSIEHDTNLTESQLYELKKTKQNAEAQLAKFRNQNVDSEKPLSSVRMTLTKRRKAAKTAMGTKRWTLK